MPTYNLTWSWLIIQETNLLGCSRSMTTPVASDSSVDVTRFCFVHNNEGRSFVFSAYTSGPATDSCGKNRTFMTQAEVDQATWGGHKGSHHRTNQYGASWAPISHLLLFSQEEELLFLSFFLAPLPEGCYALSPIWMSREEESAQRWFKCFPATAN